MKLKTPLNDNQLYGLTRAIEILKVLADGDICFRLAEEILRSFEHNLEEVKKEASHND